MPEKIEETWIARILTSAGTEYFHTKPAMTVTKEDVKGDHITEEIAYTDALSRKIRKEYFFILYLKVASARNADCEPGITGSGLFSVALLTA